MGVSVTAAAVRFLLLCYSQIAGLCFAVVFFALMWWAYGWELDQLILSVLSAIESNLRMPGPFLFFAALPILFALLFSFLSSKDLPPIISFSVVSILCYVFVNGMVVILIISSQLLFCVVRILLRLINISSSFVKVVRIIAWFVVLVLVCSVHPALRPFVLLLSHVLCCGDSLSRHVQTTREFHDSGNEREGRRKSTRSYGERQLGIFHHWHGLLVLHFLAALMFVPSLVAWYQRKTAPWFWDSVLCIGVLLHRLFYSNRVLYCYGFHIPGIPFGLSLACFLAVYYSYISALALAAYKVFYPMAAIGMVSFIYRIIRKFRKMPTMKKREKQ